MQKWTNLGKTHVFLTKGGTIMIRGPPKTTDSPRSSSGKHQATKRIRRTLR